MNDDPSMPERLRKLKALADHPETPPAEAEAARAKLRKLCSQAGIHEDQLSDEARIPWTATVPASLKLLWISCAAFILDDCQTGIRLAKGRKGTLTLHIATTVMDRADIERCFSYYHSLWQRGQSRISDQMAEKRAAIKAAQIDLKVLAKSRRIMGDEMIAKYSIFPPSLFARVKEQRAAEQAAPSTKPAKKAPLRKVTEADRQRWAAQSKARGSVTGDAWSKPTADLGGETKLLNSKRSTPRPAAWAAGQLF